MFKELARKAKAGDIGSKEEIINRSQPLIISSIKRYYFNKNEFEDLMQEGNLKILESIELYDEAKGVYFLGFIKVELKYMYLNKHKQRTHSSLNQKLEGGIGEIGEKLGVSYRTVVNTKTMALKKLKKIIQAEF